MKKNHKLFLFFSLALLIIASLYVYGRGPVEISTDKYAYTLGTDEKVILTLHNRSIPDFTYNLGCLPAVSFEQFNQKSSTWETSVAGSYGFGITVCPDMLSAVDRKILSIGEGLEMSRYISEKYAEPGRYRAVYKYENEIYTSNEFILK